MARRLLTGLEALELVLQDGSDDDEGMYSNERGDGEEDIDDDDLDFAFDASLADAVSSESSGESDDNEGVAPAAASRSRSSSRTPKSRSTTTRSSSSSRSSSRSSSLLIPSESTAVAGPSSYRPNTVQDQGAPADQGSLSAAFDAGVNPEAERGYLDLAGIGMDEEMASYMTEWVTDLTDFPIVPPFTGNPGFQVDMAEDAKPLDFYMLFVTTDIIKQMKKETNRYAKQVIAQKEAVADVRLLPRSMFRTWKKVAIS
ncbi:zinc finger mym-type protein 2 isoform x1 [Elysia marginata]|uniref:Zinc finger mym-type protein 2 isoform x1 n=1 Tax=Elysia marginata TaxID=1093978 RepID=A0AAV4G5C1_9GAST|nr:zinc finger mym-type protein 2 isoform x1 [Elysia marginata]